MELLVSQDICDGKVVIVIDPKGDADLMLRVYAEAARAGRPVSEPLSPGLPGDQLALQRHRQLCAHHRSRQPRDQRPALIGQLRRLQGIRGASPIWSPRDRWRWDRSPPTSPAARHHRHRAAVPELRQARARRRGAAGLGGSRRPSRSPDRERMIPVPRAPAGSHPAPGGPGAHPQDLQLPDPVLQGLATAVRYERSFFEKIIASLGPFLEKLTTGDTGKLISPDYFDASDKRPIFDWMQVIRQRGIVYVGLDALSDATVAGARGQRHAGRSGERGRQALQVRARSASPGREDRAPRSGRHFDEVNGSSAPSSCPWWNKMGGAGYDPCLYPDRARHRGPRRRRGQSTTDLGNFNNVVMMRVKSHATAEFLVDQLPRSMSRSSP